MQHFSFISWMQGALNSRGASVCCRKAEADNERKRAEIFVRYHREFASYEEFNAQICIIAYHWNYLSSFNVLKEKKT